MNIHCTHCIVVQTQGLQYEMNKLLCRCRSLCACSKKTRRHKMQLFHAIIADGEIQ